MSLIKLAALAVGNYSIAGLVARRICGGLFNRKAK